VLNGCGRSGRTVVLPRTHWRRLALVNAAVDLDDAGDRAGQDLCDPERPAVRPRQVNDIVPDFDLQLGQAQALFLEDVPDRLGEILVAESSNA
jgi:hypothetical protein